MASNDNTAGTSILDLELTVNNHPGVMSHVCGLFSRRGYNLEAIAVFPMADGKTSKMWLRVNEENRLEQVVKQIRKLPDVLDVLVYEGEHPVFTDLHTFV